MSWGSLAISASGLAAERLRLEVISQNVANMETTRTPEGGPYRRRQVVFAEVLDGTRLEFPGAGVRVSQVVVGNEAPQLVYQPEHPDANAEGYVALPGIDLLTELTDMLTANRVYEANVTVFNAAKTMALKGLELGRA